MSALFTRALYGLGLAIFWLRLDGLVRWLGRGNPKVLLYHDVAPAETAYTRGLDCTTTTEQFRAHLRWLARRYRVIGLEQLLGGPRPERSVAITFDDGYRSVWEHAFPALRDEAMPATLYLISDAVDNRAMVWVNALNYWLEAQPVAAGAALRALMDAPAAASAPDLIAFCRVNYDPRRVGDVLERLREAFPDEHAAAIAGTPLFVDWDEVRAMGDGGFTFGNHTVTHPNLARLTPEEQRAEITGAQAEIERHIRPIPSLAYPFGHHGAETAGLAAEAGLTSVAEVGGHNGRLTPMAIGRTHIGDESVAGLFARMEVVEPIKARLRMLRDG